MNDNEFRELRNDVTEIKIALKGYNGRRGLIQAHEALAKDYYGFKRKCLIVGGVILGGGGLTGGGIGIFKLLAGG